ncbi:hypothetical protein ABT340_15685 [Streptosporangium sp. NPDC000239]|uniref:hypothetical protein n=1 Tax=Streptosporangium sp. NPDC000239 TaxID=3154248 RepID=UPI0033173698
MQCEVFLCQDDATHKAQVLLPAEVKWSFSVCKSHASGERRIEATVISTELLEKPRCEWNISGGLPIEQCPEDATGEEDGEWYCGEHMEMFLADY